MKNVLNREVLVLNRNWVPVEKMPVEKVLGMMYTDAARGLDTSTDMPLVWSDWVALPIRDEDDIVHSSRLSIRVPTVIVLRDFAKVPTKEQKFNLRSIARRDGFKDGYTGEPLPDPKDWSMDHVDPLRHDDASKRGEDRPENVVLCHKVRNNRKGNRTPEEMGWKRPKPGPLRKVPATALLEPSHPDHKRFLFRK